MRLLFTNTCAEPLGTVEVGQERYCLSHNHTRIGKGHLTRLKRVCTPHHWTVPRNVGRQSFNKNNKEKNKSEVFDSFNCKTSHKNANN